MKRLYQLDHVIGMGGMGVVYAAHKLNPEPLPVAVKILRQDLPPEQFEHAAQMFRREAVSSWRTHNDHKNLVSVYDCDVMEDGLPYIIMELIDGVNLGMLYWGKGPEYPLIRRIAHEVLGALGHLHDHGLLHRDVSPGNVLLSQSGTIKLADLGLVKAREDEHSGLLHGTPAYASPEALQGLPRTPCSDLYSLGAVLYTLLTGAPPYGSGPPQDVVRAMYKEEHEFPVWPECTPDDLMELVEGLTRFRPDERFQSTSEALARLRGPLASCSEVATKVAESPCPEPNTSNLPDLGWPFRDHKMKRLGWITGLSLVLLLSAGLLGLGHGWSHTRTASVEHASPACSEPDVEESRKEGPTPGTDSPSSTANDEPGNERPGESAVGASEPAPLRARAHSTPIDPRAEASEDEPTERVRRSFSLIR